MQIAAFFFFFSFFFTIFSNWIIFLNEYPVNAEPQRKTKNVSSRKAEREAASGESVACLTPFQRQWRAFLSSELQMKKGLRVKSAAARAALADTGQSNTSKATTHIYQAATSRGTRKKHTLLNEITHGLKKGGATAETNAVCASNNETRAMEPTVCKKYEAFEVSRCSELWPRTRRGVLFDPPVFTTVFSS